MIKKEVRKLPNGLTIVCVSNDEKHNIGATIYVKYGSGVKDFKIGDKEYHYPDGIAHLLEHVVIDESVYGNIGKIFFENHVDFNGLTGSYQTRYYINTYEDFETHFVKLMNIVNNAVFTPESIEHSKGPVFVEIKRKKDRRSFDLEVETRKSLYKKPDLLTGVGEIEDVAKFNYDDLSAIYNAFYKPSNEMIAVYGNFDIDKIVKLIEDTYDSFKRDYLEAEVEKYDEPNEVARDYYELIDKEDFPIVNISYKIPIEHITGFDKLLLPIFIRDYLKSNFSRRSEVYTNMIKDNITKFSIQTGFYYAYDNKFVQLSIYVRTENVDEAVRRVSEVIDNNKLISKRDFDIARKKQKLYFIFSEDDPKVFACGYIDNVLSCNYHEFDKYEDLDLFTYEKMEEIMCKLDFSNKSVIVRKNA